LTSSTNSAAAVGSATGSTEPRLQRTHRTAQATAEHVSERTGAATGTCDARAQRQRTPPRLALAGRPTHGTWHTAAADDRGADARGHATGTMQLHP
jgi:hypothetical protein